MPKTFVEAVVSGESSLDQIDDYVHEWYAGDSDLPLHEFLGMTEEEYAVWFRFPAKLHSIIDAHR